MSTAKRIALIAFGYVVALAGGCVAVAVHEAFMPDDISQASSGMVAFGDMVLFLLTSGVLALAPSWMLLTLAAAKAPRERYGNVRAAAAVPSNPRRVKPCMLT